MYIYFLKTPCHTMLSFTELWKYLFFFSYLNKYSLLVLLNINIRIELLLWSRIFKVKVTKNGYTKTEERTFLTPFINTQFVLYNILQRPFGTGAFMIHFVTSLFKVGIKTHFITLLVGILFFTCSKKYLTQIMKNESGNVMIFI